MSSSGLGCEKFNLVSLSWCEIRIVLDTTVKWLTPNELRHFATALAQMEGVPHWPLPEVRENVALQCLCKPTTYSAMLDVQYPDFGMAFMHRILPLSVDIPADPTFTGHLFNNLSLYRHTPAAHPHSSWQAQTSGHQLCFVTAKQWYEWLHKGFVGARTTSLYEFLNCIVPTNAQHFWLGMLLKYFPMWYESKPGILAVRSPYGAVTRLMWDYRYGYSYVGINSDPNIQQRHHDISVLRGSRARSQTYQALELGLLWKKTVCLQVQINLPAATTLETVTLSMVRSRAPMPLNELAHFIEQCPEFDMLKRQLQEIYCTCGRDTESRRPGSHIPWQLVLGDKSLTPSLLNRYICHWTPDLIPLKVYFMMGNMWECHVESKYSQTHRVDDGHSIDQGRDKDDNLGCYRTAKVRVTESNEELKGKRPVIRRLAKKRRQK